ncbi:MAG: putative Ig domain-containing protein, partial [Tropheryma whipplei]|nr:putative Ig domain-containing protein [Tropheryma whipplei]
MPGTNHIPSFLFLNPTNGAIQGNIQTNVEPGNYVFPVIADSTTAYIYVVQVVTSGTPQITTQGTTLVAPSGPTTPVVVVPPVTLT